MHSCMLLCFLVLAVHCLQEESSIPTSNSPSQPRSPLPPPALKEFQPLPPTLFVVNNTTDMCGGSCGLWPAMVYLVCLACDVPILLLSPLEKGSPWTPPPLDQSDHRRGKKRNFIRENLIGPFLVHKLLGSRPPPPPLIIFRC